MLTSRGLGRVLGDLASMGFDARWGVLGAADVGANHQRDRIWIVATNVAYTECSGLERQPRNEFISTSGSSFNGSGGLSADELAHTENQRNVWEQWRMGFTEQEHDSRRGSINGRGQWWQAEPNVGRVADGVAARVDRLKAIGNGQVPLCVATAWKLLSERI